MTTTPPDNSEWIDEWLLEVARLGGGMDNYGAPSDDELKEFNTYKEAKAQIIAKLREARIQELKNIRRPDNLRFVVASAGDLVAREDNFYIKPEAVKDRIKELESNSPQGEEAETV